MALRPPIAAALHIDRISVSSLCRTTCKGPPFAAGTARCRSFAGPVNIRRTKSIGAVGHGVNQIGEGGGGDSRRLRSFAFEVLLALPGSQYRRATPLEPDLTQIVLHASVNVARSGRSHPGVLRCGFAALGEALEQRRMAPMQRPGE